MFSGFDIFIPSPQNHPGKIVDHHFSAGNLEAMYNIGMASKMNPWLNPTKVQQHRPSNQRIHAVFWVGYFFREKSSPVGLKKTHVFFLFF